MYDDDRDFPEVVQAQPELREHEFDGVRNTVEVTITELRQALAVLSILEMDEDLEAADQTLWLH